jgi:hypothetical protein
MVKSLYGEEYDSAFSLWSVTFLSSRLLEREGFAFPRERMVLPFW